MASNARFTNPLLPRITVNANRRTSTEIQIHVKEFLKTKKNLNGILVKRTRRTLDEIEKDTDRDNFMSAVEAKEYGLIAGVLEKRPEG